MLNCKYLKSLGGKINLFALPPNPQGNYYHSVNAVKVENDQSRFLQNPSPLQACRQNVTNIQETKALEKETTRKKAFQENCKRQNPTALVSSRKLSTKDATKLRGRNETTKCKYQEYATQKQEKYELEAAKPKKDPTKMIYNVYKSVAKEVDLNDHLQPNNLKPYGAQDNIYMPILMSNKNSCLVFTNPSYLPPDRQSVNQNNIPSEHEEIDDYS